MQIRRGTLLAWASANPTLEPGELGFVTDAGTTAFKIGDGTTVWNLLAYVNSTYPELPVDAGLDLNNSYVQGRYPLLSTNVYGNKPTDFTASTDGNSLLLVTVPSNTIVIQELTTSATPCKRWIRARGTTSTWTAWKRIDTLSTTESLSITNLTLSGDLIVGGRTFLSAGTAPLPSLTITGDTTTGLYQSAAQQIGIATNGVSRVRVGDALTTVTTPLTVTGLVTANAGSGFPALTVAAGTTSLKYTEVAGILKVMPTAGNRLTVGGATSGTLGSVEVYIDSSPTIAAKAKTSGGVTTDAELLWAGYNRLNSQTTSIRTDGVPTNDSDLTTKSYVDGLVGNLALTRLTTDRTNIEAARIVAGVIDTGIATNLHGQLTNINIALTSIPIGGKQTFTYRRGTGSSTAAAAACTVSITITAGSGNTFCVTQKVVSGSAFTSILSPTLLLDSYDNPPSPSPTLYSATQALLSNVYASSTPALGYAGFTIYRLS